MKSFSIKDIWNELRQDERERFYQRLARRDENDKVPTHYFVDYENVQGLPDIVKVKKISDSDRVFIIRTTNTKITHEELQEHDTRPNYYTIYSGVGKEYADNFLIALLSLDVTLNKSTCRYVVVSRDSEFSQVNGLVRDLYELADDQITMIGIEPPLVQTTKPVQSETTKPESPPAKNKKPSSSVCKAQAPIIGNSVCDNSFQVFVSIIRQTESLSESDEKYAILRECWIRFFNDGKLRSMLQLCHDTLCSAWHSDGIELFRKLRKDFKTLQPSSLK